MLQTGFWYLLKVNPNALVQGGISTPIHPSPKEAVLQQWVRCWVLETALAMLLAALAGGDGQHSRRLAGAAVLGGELCRGAAGWAQPSRVAGSKLHLMPAVKSPRRPLPWHEPSPGAFTMTRFHILLTAAPFWSGSGCRPAQPPAPGEACG